MHREFSYESFGERILKIGPHLPKLLSNIKWLTFLEHGVLFVNHGNTSWNLYIYVLMVMSTCIDIVYTVNYYTVVQKKCANFGGL